MSAAGFVPTNPPNMSSVPNLSFSPWNATTGLASNGCGTRHAATWLLSWLPASKFAWCSSSASFTAQSCPSAKT
eukprot:UN03459